MTMAALYSAASYQGPLNPCHLFHVLSIVAKFRAVPLSSVRNGGEGRGEEALRIGETARKGGAPLSPTLSPFVPHGAREPDALLGAAISARTFAKIDRCAHLRQLNGFSIGPGPDLHTNRP